MPKRTRLRKGLVPPHKRTGRIPALTLSGGVLKKLSDAKEFRIWVHPKKGADYYYTSKTLPKAVAMGVSALVKKEGAIETPLAVVWDAKNKNWREVIVPTKYWKK